MLCSPARINSDTFYMRLKNCATLLTGVILFGATIAGFALPVHAQGFSCNPSYFLNDLHSHDTGPAIAELQRVLNSDVDTLVALYGAGSPGKESTYFGVRTYNAVRRFQEKYAEEILLPFGFTQGIGFVGENTRTKLIEVCNRLREADRASRAPVVEDDGIFPFRDMVEVIQPVSASVKTTYIGSGGFWSFVFAVLLVWGINFILWGLVGLIRIITEFLDQLFFRQKNKGVTKNEVEVGDVAALVPAHNEELVIADTLTALSVLVEPKNIYIVSDGSMDRTGEIARAYGANVLELNPGRGKAGALETCIKHFDIANRYKAIALVDADTRLKPDYLKLALPFFNDPEVVAVAGYASTIWNPEKLTWKQRLFVSHRDRVYFLSQRLVKFGQTWKYTSVTPIVPGFASLYRTTILDKVTMNPPGIVIEDFNMTFEVHHKKLGKIAHHPSIIAYTQDPDNVRDYFRQVKRWHLGFWQTVRFHGFWLSKFWAAMTLTLIEVVSGSLVFLLLPFLIFISLIPEVAHVSSWPEFLDLKSLISGFLLGVYLSDYLLTIVAAIFQKRPLYLLVGLFFPVVRVLDAWAFLSAIPRAFLVKSNGQWISPTRRTS